ncbi:MAG TPA: DUF1015 family protein [Gammaproteobacteria bacterium]|nr:DUF1015 family protein [Gammaproteobacteria bacterium]
MNHLVKPFAALRPSADHAGAVVAPPYDVVSTAEARALVAGRPNSFLHISRPEIDLPESTDPHSDLVYAKARENLDRLIGLGLLVRDPSPGYYVYRMRMGAHEQTGVAVAASIAAYEENRVRRHELTRPDKETDRVRNIASLNAQTGPVLSAYRADPELAALLASAARGTPTIDVVGPHGVVHTVWRVADPEAVRAITRAFDRLGLIYIADGHHRSAAAARVAAQRRARGPQSNEQSFEFFLSVVFPHDQMRILDYNRVITDRNGLTIDQLLASLDGKFTVAERDGAVKPGAPNTFGMYSSGRWFELRIRPELIPADDPVAQLDVSLLQKHLITPILGVDDPRTNPRIDFVGGIRGLDELERRADAAGNGVALAFYPTSMEQLMAVADAGQLMPPKSTWFEPKLADGLLSHVLD